MGLPTAAPESDAHARFSSSPPKEALKPSNCGGDERNVVPVRCCLSQRLGRPLPGVVLPAGTACRCAVPAHAPGPPARQRGAPSCCPRAARLCYRLSPAAAARRAMQRLPLASRPQAGRCQAGAVVWRCNASAATGKPRAAAGERVERRSRGVPWVLAAPDRRHIEGNSCFVRGLLAAIARRSPPDRSRLPRLQNPRPRPRGRRQMLELLQRDCESGASDIRRIPRVSRTHG